MQDVDQLRSEVARACQVLGRLGLTHEPQGHVSARIPGTDRVLIKGRGPAEAPLSYTTERDIITIDMDGKMLEGRDGLVSAGEIFIHVRLYRARPDVQSVVHVHPRTVVLFTVCDKPLQQILGSYNPVALRMLREGIPTYPRAILINTPERGDELAALMGQSRACMLRGHGIATVGSSVREATLAAITLNDLAEMNYRAYLLGNPQPIADEDIEELSGASPGGIAPADKTSVFPYSEWAYFDKLVGD